MTIQIFLKLVEIKTKIASFFPFLIGLLFTYYRYGTINLTNTVIFFLAMIIFDMTTTAINNYMDFSKATHEEYRKNSNIIGVEGLNVRSVRNLIFFMLVLAIGLGLYLVYLTSLIVLFTGIICFAIGIFYTFGPLPLSRMPLGEIFSGLTMGIGILFLTVFVNTYHLGYINLSIANGALTLFLQIPELLIILLAAIPSIFTIANLMLANNICDLEEDIKNERFTIVYYLGKKASINLFMLLYTLSFLSIIISVAIGIHNPLMLISLGVLPSVIGQVRAFKKKQVKSETFIVAVKNLVLIDGSLVIGLLLSIAFGR